MQKINDAGELAKHSVVVTTFDTIKTLMNFQTLQKISFERIIIYDAYPIDNTDTQRYKALRQLDATYRWVLTGNLLQQNLANFLKLGEYGDDQLWDTQICPILEGKQCDEKTELSKKIENLLKSVELKFPLEK